MRAEMIAQLGGKCVWCGETRDLEFDHIQPRDYSARRLSWLQRINRYREEMKEGKIQLLCRSCNARKQRLDCSRDPNEELIQEGGIPTGDPF